MWQGIFHYKAAKREGRGLARERHGESWWLQMSNLSKEEPGFDGAEGIGMRECVDRCVEVGWIGVGGKS